MVKTECQASIIMRQVSIIMCIFYGIQDLFFSVWVLRQQGKEEAIILALLFHFHSLRISLGFQRLHLSERLNDERGVHKRIQEPYYIFPLSKPL